MIILQKYIVPAYEVVERKGINHPDTLADGISESISRSLSQLYLDEFGHILHHNVDKVLIVAGNSAPRFGGGEILKPPSVIVGGRATKPSSKPLNDIITESVTSFFRKTVKNLHQFRVEPRVEEGAPKLRSLIGRGDDGATGRGNRNNGLITPMRPMTMEAIAGKNPVSHVGKIGSPISQPLLRGVRISGDLQITSGFESHVNYILDYRLESADSLIEEFVKGRLTIY